MEILWLIVIAGALVIGFAVLLVLVDWLARDSGDLPYKPTHQLPRRPSGMQASIDFSGHISPPTPVSNDVLREIAIAMVFRQGDASSLRYGRV